MGQMKNLLITVYGGGDEAVAAVQRMGEDWRAQLEQAAAEIERLRDELASATRHMELAESAWLRETAGNPPVTKPLPK